jgi:hypothetical protein
MIVGRSGLPKPQRRPAATLTNEPSRPARGVTNRDDDIRVAQPGPWSGVRLEDTGDRSEAYREQIARSERDTIFGENSGTAYAVLSTARSSSTASAP